MLEQGEDLSKLADPSELFVHFDPPKPFDESWGFCLDRTFIVFLRWVSIKVLRV